MGRSGRLLAAEHYGVRADVTVLSKALGGGLPLARRADDRRRRRQSLEPGMHGCTFGGSPVATAAGALRARRASTKPRFLAARAPRGRALGEGLERAGRAPSVARRGARPRPAARDRDRARTRRSTRRRSCAPRAREGLLLVRGGERAVRLLPPLTVTHGARSHEALERLDRALTTLEARPGGRSVS